jgi:hypothetical protein
MTMNCFVRLRIARSFSFIRPSQTRFSRGLATAKPINKKLPLAGIHVLDMSRVLAGVSTDASIETDVLQT